MAHQIPDFPEAVAHRLRKFSKQSRARRPLSFYKRYMDGDAWSLGPEDSLRGDSSLVALKNTLIAAAARYGLDIRIQIVNERVEMQAIREERTPIEGHERLRTYTRAKP